MKSHQEILGENTSAETTAAKLKSLSYIEPQLVFLFGPNSTFEQNGFASQMRQSMKNAIIIGCSTAGEIAKSGVTENKTIVTAIKFKEPVLKSASAQITSAASSYSSGRALGETLRSPSLKAVIILSPGVNVNGSALINGLRSAIGHRVIVTGGLAGDYNAFERTFTHLNGESTTDRVVAVGFYGDSVKISCGSKGGWAPFGPVRQVTRASDTVLLELDGEPVLDVYKSYLGEHAKELPGSALFFPLAILRENHDDSGLIRTVLGVDEQAKSLILAGDISEGSYVRLMHSSTQSLVDGARRAALTAAELVKQVDTEGFGLFISCVGRKLVMADDTDDELDAVQSILNTSMHTGFYSYGEICPELGLTDCKLHNQTMTITYFYE